jgi:hypothetical protein
MATDLSADIASQAIEPASASADGQIASARPVADLILADQYLAGKVALKRKARGIQFSKLIPPAAYSDQGGTGGLR